MDTMDIFSRYLESLEAAVVNMVCLTTADTQLYGSKIHL